MQLLNVVLEKCDIELVVAVNMTAGVRLLFVLRYSMVGSDYSIDSDKPASLVGSGSESPDPPVDGIAPVVAVEIALLQLHL